MASHLAEYARTKWPQWEPTTRRNAQRDLSRAVIYLVANDAPELTAADRVALDVYLRTMVLTSTPSTIDAAEEERWQGWLGRWSLPLDDVSDRHLQAFLDHVRTTALDGTARTLAPASVARTRAVVRGAFTAARKRRLLEWDPFEAVDAPVLRDHDQVDPDLVMSPADVIAIAQACAQIDPRYEAFVLTQGLCGLRPGEAVELRARNLTITNGQPTAVTVRGTHAEVPDRFLLDGETRRRPLKGRGHRASRTIPVFTVLRPVLARHLEAYTDGRDAARVFTNTAGSKINLSNFHRDVWDAARTATFPADSPLRHVRRHDLRHAAITAWLNAGVPLKTCQAWSGHTTVSVLLDTYLGATRGDDQLGQQRVDDALNDLLDHDDNDDNEQHDPED